MSQKQAEAQMAAKVVNLREKLNQLPKVQQEAVANYFNMYNCAAWLFNEILTPDAKDYVDQSIQYARELNELDSLKDTLDSQEQQFEVDRLNDRIQEAEELLGKTLNDNLKNGKEGCKLHGDK